MTATLALGTHRCRSATRSATIATAAGTTWIDTAPNYAGGTAEQQLATALAGDPNIGVSTKVGFIPPQDEHPAQQAGVLTGHALAMGHSLAPSYLSWQIERSRHRLGRVPDVLFLHNPEHGYSGGTDHLAPTILAAFATLEDAANAGYINGYGVATWSGFNSDLFDVPTLVELARKAGGSQHRLRAIQLPISLIHLRPIAEALDSHGVLADASHAGLETYASAPLGGGNIPHLVTPELVDLISPGATPAQAALAVTASAPGVHRVLLSASTETHWAEALTTFNQPPLPSDRLRQIIDVLGT